MIKRLMLFLLIMTTLGLQTKAQTEHSIPQNTLQNTNIVSIAVILPFANESDGQSARFIEYYEGLLIALQEMKAKGFSANIYAFDIGSESGTEKLISLLDTYEMKYLDLIVGGVSPQQIAVISDFARRQGIKYAIPFPTKTNDVQHNPYVFQVNAPRSTLYANVAKAFVNIFPDTKVIYIAENESTDDRIEFISTLDTELVRAGMMSDKIMIDDTLKDNLRSLIDPDKRNIIVPTSASAKSLQSIFPVLKTICGESPEIRITLFGHTDWQTYNQYKKEFGLYDTHIYTPFFFDKNDSRIDQFLVEYKKWYDNKNLINTYPRYAILGYDTGMFFFTALWQYGKNFDLNINSIVTSSLQTSFLPEKENPPGGYMNTGFYIVRYREDGSIEKTEYGR